MQIKISTIRLVPRLGPSSASPILPRALSSDPILGITYNALRVSGSNQGWCSKNESPSIDIYTVAQAQHTLRVKVCTCMSTEILVYNLQIALVCPCQGYHTNRLNINFVVYLR